jgi:hypothetical protein
MSRDRFEFDGDRRDQRDRPREDDYTSARPEERRNRYDPPDRSTFDTAAARRAAERARRERRERADHGGEHSSANRIPQSSPDGNYNHSRGETRKDARPDLDRLIRRAMADGRQQANDHPWWDRDGTFSNGILGHMLGLDDHRRGRQAKEQDVIEALDGAGYTREDAGRVNAVLARVGLDLRMREPDGESSRRPAPEDPDRRAERTGYHDRRRDGFDPRENPHGDRDWTDTAARNRREEEQANLRRGTDKARAHNEASRVAQREADRMWERDDYDRSLPSRNPEAENARHRRIERDLMDAAVREDARHASVTNTFEERARHAYEVERINADSTREAERHAHEMYRHVQYPEALRRERGERAVAQETEPRSIGERILNGVRSLLS